MAEGSEDTQPEARKRLGRPKVTVAAKPVSRTVRIPLQTYDEMTSYLKNLIERTGKQIDRKDLIAHAWDVFRHTNQTAKWDLVTGDRRVILLTVLGFLAEVPQGHPDAELVDSMLLTLGVAVKLSTRMMRINRKAAQLS